MKKEVNKQGETDMQRQTDSVMIRDKKTKNVCRVTARENVQTAKKKEDFKIKKRGLH